VAWYLQLTAELREWVQDNDDPQAKSWLGNLEQLERDIADSLKAWLPKLAYPIRLGTHNQSAFAFGLMLDWARVAGDEEMERLIIEKSLAFHKRQFRQMALEIGSLPALSKTPVTGSSSILTG